MGDAVVNHFMITMIAFLIMQLARKTDLYGTLSSKDGQDGGRPSRRLSLREAFMSMAVIGLRFLGRIRTVPVYRLAAAGMRALRARWATG